MLMFPRIWERGNIQGGNSNDGNNEIQFET